MPYKIGTKQTTRAVEQGIAARVLVAGDADQRLTGKILELCAEAQIEVERVETMELLGETCGIEVGAAMAAWVPEEQ